LEREIKEYEEKIAKTRKCFEEVGRVPAIKHIDKFDWCKFFDCFISVTIF
jgi:hypothetical protein